MQKGEASAAFLSREGNGVRERVEMVVWHSAGVLVQTIAEKFLSGRPTASEE